MQDEVNQDYSEQNGVDGMKKGAVSKLESVYITNSIKNTSIKFEPLSLPQFEVVVVCFNLFDS